MELNAEFLFPFQTLRPGHEIFFKTFPEAAPYPITTGVIVSVEVQVATMFDGSTQVQTVLHLAPLPSFLAGRHEATHSVLVENLETITIEAFHAGLEVAPVSRSAEGMEAKPSYDVDAPGKIMKLSDVMNLYRRRRDSAGTKSFTATKKKSATKPKSAPKVLGRSKR